MFWNLHLTGGRVMKHYEPDFAQWTDQNHMPFLNQVLAQSQNNSNNQPAAHGFNMLWRNVLKFFNHSRTGGSARKSGTPPYLS
jgi:hypothetical protein